MDISKKLLTILGQNGSSTVTPMTFDINFFKLKKYAKHYKTINLKNFKKKWILVTKIQWLFKKIDIRVASALEHHNTYVDPNFIIRVVKKKFKKNVGNSKRVELVQKLASTCLMQR